ncbi:DUF1771-domain-containing protein [Pleomassaria siparia CBS 279.74]|uniref:DUF1771-domain-containing protein n=1 Tax=Pleomassaria siparia CBS 279.74 TaxID=1314801 RepID=A0A6G1KCI6_9PLEO|nr:DUF1771-domain-containing protein [Pleomassaria siparia CBS 279.74]
MAARQRSPVGSPPDRTSINLNRLLSRLEQTVLVEPSPSLRKCQYDRKRVRANIEHARTLLLNLEHTSTTLPTKSKKTALQTDLQQKRALIKQLNQRLIELDQLDDDSSSEDSVDSDEEDQDRFPSYAPHVQADAGIEVTGTGGEGNEAFQDAARNLTSQLRRRGGGGEAQDGTATTATGNSLFGANSKAAATTDSSLAQSEAVLSHNRSEQENLTTSLLDMAKQLKQQSLQFGSTLEADKGIVNRTVDNLDKNMQGMDAAGQRMGTLRRMVEGKGWWARMKLYALIFGLWVMAFLILVKAWLSDTGGGGLWRKVIPFAFCLFSTGGMEDGGRLSPCGVMWHMNALNHSSSDTEAEYDRLRGLAREEAGKRSSCFDQAHQAYSSGDGARAHQLSEEGKQHAAKMDQYNAQARDYIFRANNSGERVASDTIDLHGLYVEEAEDVLEERIRVARQQGQTHLHVIVGKGNHSANHVQKIKPRVEQVCKELGLQYNTEANEGRMYINLQGGSAANPPQPHVPQHGGEQHSGSGYPGGHGGQQQHGGQHQSGQGQQPQHGGQNQNNQQDDGMEQLVKKGLPKFFKALKGCCIVM